MRQSPLQPVNGGRRGRGGRRRRGNALGTTVPGGWTRPPAPRRRTWLLVPALLVAAAVAAAGTGLVRAALHSGEPLPGARVAGIAVDGLKGRALERRVQAALAPRLRTPVTVDVGGRRVQVVPGDVVALDAVRTAAAARAAGRGSVRREAAALLLPTPPRRDVAPVLRIRRDGLVALTARLAAYGTPPRNAAVLVVGATPRAVPGKSGVVVDAERLAGALRDLVAAGGAGPLRAALKQAPPPIDAQEAQIAVLDAQRLLAAPVALRVGGIDSGALQPAELGRALRVEPQGVRLVARLDQAALWTTVKERVDRFRVKGIDARFRAKGRRVAVVPSVDGLDVQPGRAAAAVLAAMRAPSGVARVAQLNVVPVPAAFTTDDALALGVRQRVMSFTTEMGDSSANRIHNVHLMADYIDGTIVKPGETFSFNKVVGPRTTARGFLEGQAIYGTVAVASIGGGVCQTATTLFNNAFELGLPVLARWNHTTYIAHYPVGRDATVSWGGPDLVFRNDLRNALLIKASYTDKTLTFTFYGTPQGRKVIERTGPRTNLVEPQLRYALDLNAAPGSVTTARGSGQPGFDITIFRQVLEEGKLVRSDSFTSHYLDEGPTKVYGPGQEVPRPYIVIPKENV